MTVDWIRAGLKQDRQNPQRPRQGARPLAFRRDRSAQRPPPPARRRDRDRRRISRHRTAAAASAAAARRSAEGAAGRLCRRRRDRPFLRRRPGAVRRGRRADRRQAVRRSRCRSAAIRSARCSTTGWSSTTTSAIRRTTASSGACASAASADGRVLIKALKHSQNAGLWTSALQHRAADLRRRPRLGRAGARDAAEVAGRAAGSAER